MSLFCTPFHQNNSPSEQCEAVEERDSTRASMRRRLSSSCLMLQRVETGKCWKSGLFFQRSFEDFEVKFGQDSCHRCKGPQPSARTQTHFETTRSCHLDVSNMFRTALCLPLDSFRILLNDPQLSETPNLLADRQVSTSARKPGIVGILGIRNTFTLWFNGIVVSVSGFSCFLFFCKLDIQKES